MFRFRLTTLLRPHLTTARRLNGRPLLPDRLIAGPKPRRGLIRQRSRNGALKAFTGRGATPITTAAMRATVATIFSIGHGSTGNEGSDQRFSTQMETWGGQ